MKKKLTVIHTTMATVSTIPAMIREMYGDVFTLVNVMDDSLLNEIKEEGTLTRSVIQRFLQYALIAQNNHSDAILLVCSSIGPCADIAREVLSIPILKIDEPMAQEAVEKGRRILVLGTVKSTLEPTAQLIKGKASPQQQVDARCIEGVFELYAKDIDAHDRSIAQVVLQEQEHYDVIVLAQASMAGALRFVGSGKEQVLTSLPKGLQQLKEL